MICYSLNQFPTPLPLRSWFRTLRCFLMFPGDSDNPPHLESTGIGHSPAAESPRSLVWKVLRAAQSSFPPMAGSPCLWQMWLKAMRSVQEKSSLHEPRSAFTHCSSGWKLREQIHSPSVSSWREGVGGMVHRVDEGRFIQTDMLWSEAWICPHCSGYAEPFSHTHVPAEWLQNL